MSTLETAHEPYPGTSKLRSHARSARRVRGTYQVTRGGAACFAAIGIIALASLNTGNNLLFMILAVVVAGVVISAVMSRVILSALQIELAFPQRIFAKDQVSVLLTIHNARRHAPAYAVAIGLSDDRSKGRAGAQVKMCAAFAPYVPPRGVLHIETGFTFKRRGLYQTLFLEINSHFPFGVLRRKQIVCAEEAILVFPEIGQADTARQAANAAGVEIENGQRGAGGDLYGIRSYHDGDPAKQIDWKATAKTGELKVREFTREAAASIDIFLDCEMSGPVNGRAQARFERAVSFCASLACEAQSNHASLQFTGAGVRTRAERGQPGVDGALGALAVIEPDAEEGRTENAPLNLTLAGSIPLVVTDRPGDPMFSAAAAAGRVIAMSDLYEPGTPRKS